MIGYVKRWFARYLSDPEAILLLSLLLLGFGLVIFMGRILAPILASLVIAYLLAWWMRNLMRYGISRNWAFFIVYSCFLGVVGAILYLFPLLWRQLSTLFHDLPSMVAKTQEQINYWVQDHPQLNAHSVIEGIAEEAKSWGRLVLSFSVASITTVIIWIVYLVLVPLLVFFFLKDQDVILNWFISFLPHKRGLITRVATEVNEQIGNYIRGKVAEIVIVGVVTYAVFWLFGLEYAAVLAFLVGLSCVVPYIGILVISIPVALVAYFQWGLTPRFGYLMLTYAVTQILDGNLLVPLLFSEAVNLHPVAIIVATLVFGGIWGFWGAFFAIPLATLFKAVIDAWPRPRRRHAV